jgi:hypothetical protein
LNVLLREDCSGATCTRGATPVRLLNDLIEECAAFPNGAHDDQVDAMTQALLRWNMVPYQQAVYYRELPEISPI